LEDFYQENQNNDESQDVAQKVRIILKASQNYQFYVQEAKKNLKFSDPMNLNDATEFMSNGEIEYRNAKIQGLANTVLNQVNLDQISENLVKYIDDNLNVYKNRAWLNSSVCIF